MSKLTEQYAWDDFKDARQRLYLIGLFNGLVAAGLMLSAYGFSAPQWPWVIGSLAVGLVFSAYVWLEQWQSSWRIIRAALAYLAVVGTIYGYWGWPAVFAPGYGLEGDPPVFSSFSLLNAIFPYLCFGVQLAGLLPFFALYRRWKHYQKQRKAN